MDFMLQLVIWAGSGCAFAIGMLAGAFIAGSIARRSEKPIERANELLTERNEIGKQMVQQMREIVHYLDMLYSK